MTTYNDALSDRATRQLKKQYGYGAPRYVAVAGWGTIMKVAYYDSRGYTIAQAMVKANHPMQLHYGVWDEQTRSFDSSIRNASRIAFEQIFPKNRNQALSLVDFGSGFGGVIVQLCKENPNLHATGISIDPIQISIANEISLALHLDKRIKFINKNYLELVGLKLSGFNGGLAMESLCHVPAAQLGLLWKNIAHVLEPRSRFVVHDWFCDKELSKQEVNELKIFLKGWDMPNCVSTMDIVTAAKQNGFKLILERNLTDKIMRSSKKIHFRAIVCRPIVRWSQGKNNSYLKRLSFTDPSTVDFTYTCLVQKKLFQKRLINYKQLVFEKIP